MRNCDNEFLEHCCWPCTLFEDNDLGDLKVENIDDNSSFPDHMPILLYSISMRMPIASLSSSTPILAPQIAIFLFLSGQHHVERDCQVDLDGLPLIGITIMDDHLTVTG